jgi:hypothetical protein
MNDMMRRKLAQRKREQGLFTVPKPSKPVRKYEVTPISIYIVSALLVIALLVVGFYVGYGMIKAYGDMIPEPQEMVCHDLSTKGR